MSPVSLVLCTIFNSCVRQFFEGRTQSEKRYPIFRMEVPDPYPHLNGGQIRRASGFSVPTCTESSE